MTIEVSALHHFLIRVQDPGALPKLLRGHLRVLVHRTARRCDLRPRVAGTSERGKLLAAPLGDTFLVLAPPLEGTPENDRFNERRVGVDHLAFAVPDASALDEVVTVLERAGVRTAGVEHDPVLDKSYVAFRDPDNVQWEFYASA